MMPVGSSHRFVVMMAAGIVAFVVSALLTE